MLQLVLATLLAAETRAVVGDAERVIDCLRQTDESLSQVMKDLKERG